MIKNSQFLDSFFYWNYIENHDVEVAIATYWMLSDFKKIFYRTEIIKILKITKCSLKEKNDFRAFMMRFRRNLIIEKNDFLKSMSLRDVFETSIQQTQSISSVYQNKEIFMTLNSIREFFTVERQSLYYDNFFVSIEQIIQFSIFVFKNRIQQKIKFILVENSESKTKH